MQYQNDVLERGGSGTDRLRSDDHINGTPDRWGVESSSRFGARAEACGWGARPTATSDIREFTSDQTHGFVQAEHTEVAVSSEGLGWTSAYVSRQKENPYQRSFAACPDMMIALVLSGPVPVWRTVHGVAVEKRMLPGSFGIIPAGAGFDARLDLPLESVHLYLRQAVITEVAAGLVKGDPESLEIIPRFAAFDPLVQQLTMGICEAAREAAPSSALYVDHLATALAARMVQNHSNAASQISPADSSQGLSQGLLRMVREFIEANLSRPLSLADLARGSRLSPGHFARLFKKSTGLSPYQYVVRCRIERAQRLLAETTAPIPRIAIECGFADQVHLTQAFRRIAGATPAAFRKERNR